MSGAAAEVAIEEARDREEWERFRAAVPGAEIGHAWDYHELLVEVFGVRLHRLIARRGTEPVALLPLVLQRSFMGSFLTSVPYLNYAGILGADAEARRGLAEAAVGLADGLGVDRLEVRGRDGADLPIEVWRGKSGFVAELPAEPARLWDALGAKLRAQVKRPSKDGFTSRVTTDGGRVRFYPLLARRWHELGSPTLPERFFARFERLAGPALEYVLIERGGQPAAAAVIVQSGETVEIPWAASAREHNRHGVNMLLYWAALERAVERGASRFDFGRSTPGSGNARFKLQWGAIERALCWNVLARSARGRSSERGSTGRGLVAAVWRNLPAFLAQQIGPRLAARIPL